MLFEEFGGGTWSGPADHSSAVAFAWDVDNLYVGVVVVDDTHQNGGSGWNGDAIQMVFANAAQDTVTHLYNYGLSDDGDVVIHNEKAPGGTEASINRDDGGPATFVRVKVPGSFARTGCFRKWDVDWSGSVRERRRHAGWPGRPEGLERLGTVRSSVRQDGQCNWVGNTNR